MGARKKKLYENRAAESEADRIGARFMDSTDVVGDMSRAFGHDFSDVHIYADSIGASRVAGTGVDAIAEGNNIYMGSGCREGDPASNGLLAHELTHTMQQGVGGGMGAQVSSPMGAPQGGVLDWFRKLFGKKQKPAEEMTISEPTLMDTSGMYGPGSGSPFLDDRSHTLNTMLQRGTREQLQDPMVRKLVLEDYNRNMNKRLLDSQKSGTSNGMDDGALMGGAGETANLSMIVNAALPEDFHTRALDAGQGTESGLKDANASLDFMSSELEGNQGLMDILKGTNASFEGVDRYADPESRSARTMGNLVRYAVVGQNSRDLHNAHTQMQAHSGAGMLNMADQAKVNLGKARVKQSKSLLHMADVGFSGSANRFRKLLAHLMG